MAEKPKKGLKRLCLACNEEIEENELSFMILEPTACKDYYPDKLPKELKNRQGLNIVWELHNDKYCFLEYEIMKLEEDSLFRDYGVDDF